MTDVEELQAQALRVLERARSIPRAGKPRRSRQQRHDPEWAGSPETRSPRFTEEALAAGEVALSTLQLSGGGDEDIAVRAHVDGARSGARSPPEQDEAHRAKVQGIRRWAGERAQKVDDLVDAAREALKHAVASLTGVRYGAALLTVGGLVFTGCNVESNDAALSTSAEKMAVLKALSAGYAEFEVLVITWDQTESERFPMPSGASRQYLAEFGDFDVVLVRADPARSKKELSTFELLPSLDTAQGAGGHGAGGWSKRSRSLRAARDNCTPRGFREAAVRDWGVRQVLEWLDVECDLPSYQFNFQEASVNGAMLLQLTPSDLQELVGVHHPLHLSKLVRGIDKLKKREVLEHGAESNQMDDFVDTLRPNEIIMVSRLKEAFDAVDTERRGALGANQIKSVAHGLGLDVASETVQEWIRNFGTDDSLLNFPQFVRSFYAHAAENDADLGDAGEAEYDDAGAAGPANTKLVVGPNGHIQCRENPKYDRWLRDQQHRQRVAKLGGTIPRGAPAAGSPGGKASSGDLALWLKNEAEQESAARVKSFLKARRPAARTGNDVVHAEDFARLKRLFDRADRDRSGQLTRHEAARALSKTGMKVSAVEFGQYLRLQGLDSSCGIDVFEFARAFAYFVHQREIELHRPAPGPAGGASAASNHVGLRQASPQRKWPSAYDPTGLLETLSIRSMDRRRKGHRSKHRSRSRRKSGHSRRRHKSRRSRRPRYEDSSSSGSDSDSSSSGASSSSSTSSSSSSSSGSSDSTSSSSSSSGSGSSSSSSSGSSSSGTSSSSSSGSSGSSSSSSASPARRRRRSKSAKSRSKSRSTRSQSRRGRSSSQRRTPSAVARMGSKVVRRVENAFDDAQRTGSRNQLAVNKVLAAWQSMSRSRRSKPLPSRSAIKDYFQENGVDYYATKKQFVRAYAQLCYDKADEEHDPRRSPRREHRSRSRGRGRSRSESASESDDRAAFSRGDRVEARYKGTLKWYKGEITKRNADGTYAILYDDGDMESKVRESLIRELPEGEGRRGRGHRSASKRSPSRGGRRSGSRRGGPQLERGDRVQAKFRKGRKYFKGKIVRVNDDGTYDIVYDDGDREQGVKLCNMRTLDGNAFSEDDRSGSESDSEQSFAAGDRVQARFKGGKKWFKGTIMRANSGGTYAIDYDDGDRERSVKAALIKPLDKPSKSRDREPAPLEPGTRVEAKYKGGRKWYKGKITRANADGTFDIAYDDGDKERHVHETSVRALDAPQDSADDSSEGLERGDRVEALFKGGRKWYKGTITRVRRDGSCDIDYDDGDHESSVAASKIRKLGGGGSPRKRSPRLGRRVADSDSAMEEDEEGIERGDRVEGKFKGGSKWYKGTVVRVNADGTFAIDYDDGDKERHVPARNVRKLGGSSGGKRSSPRKSRSSGLDRGTRVEAKYKNGRKWYKGKITRNNGDGTFDIAYDDGDRERGVSEDKIRSLEATAGGSDSDVGTDSIARGDRVEGKFKGGSKWYKGTVVRVNADGTFAIDYDDGDKERHVPAHNVRKLDDGAGRKRSSSPRDRGRGALDESESEGGEIARGDRVEAKFRGGSKWYKGKVMRVHVDGSFDIDYDDGDKERRVPARIVRKLGGAGGGRMSSPKRSASRSRFADDSEPDEEFKRGDRVEGKFKGGSKWYKGTIRRVNVNGTFAVDYDDGDKEERVPARNLRKLDDGTGRKRSTSPRDRGRGALDESESEGGEIARGDRVEAKFRGGSKWYKGKVMRVHVDGSFDIDYDDGDKERRVPARIVRKLGGGGGGRALSPKRPSGHSRFADDSEPDEEFKRGDRVEGKFKGGSKWYKGTIRRVNVNGTFAVDYDDGDKEERVPARNLRKLGGSSAGRERSSSPRDRGRGALDESESEGGEIARGDRVEAKFRGGSKWYKGKVMRVHVDGSFDIDYDDGDKERRVPARIVRKLGGGGGGRALSPKRPSGHSRFADDSEPDEEFKRGDRVEGKFKGGSKWYKGTIRRVNVNGTFAVDYDDGDKEERVPARNLRKLDDGTGRKRSTSPRDRGRGALNESESEGGEIARGDRVEAKFRGGSKWYKGKVMRVHVDGSFDIDYDDGDKERRVPARIVRKLGGAGGGRALSPKRPSGHSRFADDSEPDEEFKRGDRVEGKFKGGSKWYKGTIRRVNVNGTFAVDYDDGDKEERVPARNLRKLDEGTGRKRSTSPRDRGRDVLDESESEGGEIARGDRVEAKFRGGSKWYKGKVMRVHVDGSFDIDYDDGDKERRVPARIVRKLGGAGGGRISSPKRPAGRSRFADDSEPDEEFKRGDRVEGKFKGGSKWYKGTIRRVNANGTFAVDYDDGDKEERVPARNLRKLADFGSGSSPRKPADRRTRFGDESPSETEAEADFKRGDRVEAKFRGGARWYTGSIRRVNANGTFAIDYDDGDKEERVPLKLMRKLGGGGGSGGRGGLGLDSSPRRPARGGSPRSEGEELARGDEVEARFRGKSKWYKGKIMRDNPDGTYDVLYDDGDKDRNLRRSHIRKLGVSGRPPRRYSQDDLSPRPSPKPRMTYAADF